jgi:hypothetical protein
MRARGVKFDMDAEWFPNFQEELMQFPRAKHDDMVDAFAYLGLMLLQLIEAPTEKERADEIFEEEVEKSHGELHGRSSYTGY